MATTSSSRSPAGRRQVTRSPISASSRARAKGEIYGALKGIQEATRLQGEEAAGIKQSIEKLQTNKALVKQIEKVLRLRDEIDPDSIKDPEQRRKFKAFLHDLIGE